VDLDPEQDNLHLYSALLSTGMGTFMSLMEIPALPTTTATIGSKNSIQPATSLLRGELAGIKTVNLSSHAASQLMQTAMFSLLMKATTESSSSTIAATSSRHGAARVKNQGTSTIH
jgi:hypothetical protein